MSSWSFWSPQSQAASSHLGQLNFSWISAQFHEGGPESSANCGSQQKLQPRWKQPPPTRRQRKNPTGDKKIPDQPALEQGVCAKHTRSGWRMGELTVRDLWADTQLKLFLLLCHSIMKLISLGIGNSAAGNQMVSPTTFTSSRLQISKCWHQLSSPGASGAGGFERWVLKLPRQI